MSQNKVALKNFTEEELKEFVKSIGEPAFRGSQFIHGYTKVQKLLMI